MTLLLSIIILYNYERISSAIQLNLWSLQVKNYMENVLKQCFFKNASKILLFFYNFSTDAKSDTRATHYISLTKKLWLKQSTGNVYLCLLKIDNGSVPSLQYINRCKKNSPKRNLILVEPLIDRLFSASTSPTRYIT